MATRTQRLASIPIADLWVGENIRSDVGDVTSLAESIGQVGILEPLVIWPSEHGDHADVGMGQRRLAAARQAGLTEVPCILRPRPSPRDRILMQLAENHERADMSPIDKARAFRDLMELGISRRAIARQIGMTEDAVYRHIRLLDMPACIQTAVHAGTLNRTSALEFPAALVNDMAAMDRLERIGRLDDEALRGWIRGEYQRRRGTRDAIKREGVRVVAVSIDHHETARAAARKQRVTLTKWVEAAIDKATT